MIPTGFNIDECECGNLFSVKKHESSHPVIHHGKPTKDSRNSLLSIYFLETTQCACKRFYHGEEDRLVRVSSAPAQPQSNVHFVSVDLLNEYLSSLFGTSQQGKSIDAFISNKNDLNREQRGENIEITRSVFFKAFEIYIHAIKYDAEEAFGCPQCPGELLRGEKEEDFPNAREVHITDGIDMGCMQNEKKGIVSKEMFEIPTVDSGAVNFFVLVLKQNQHFLRFYEKAHINIFYDSGSQTHGGFRINISYEFTFYNSHLIPSTPFHLSILDIYFFFVRIIEHIDILSWDRTFHVEAESTFFTILLKYSPHQHFLRFWLSFHNVMIIN